MPIFRHRTPCNYGEHCQTNWQAEHFNNTLVAWIWHYKMNIKWIGTYLCRPRNTLITPRCTDRWTHLHSHWIYHVILGPIDFHSTTALTDVATATKSRHAMGTRLIHWGTTIRKGAGKPLKSTQHRYKDELDRRVCYALIDPSAWQYVYLNWPPLKTSTTEWLATESYKNQTTSSWLHLE